MMICSAHGAATSFGILAQVDVSAGMKAFSIQNIADGDGIAIAILGMLIVFVALLLISCAIAALPRLLEVFRPILPAVHHDHLPSPADQLPADQERIVAAIGYVLHSEIQRAMRAK